MPTVFSGQEGATIDFDEGVSITPFNLEEEMQEGHFDSEGNYFIKKEQQIRDNWLDNIDWVIEFFFITPLFILSLSLFLFFCLLFSDRNLLLSVGVCVFHEFVISFW